MVCPTEFRLRVSCPRSFTQGCDDGSFDSFPPFFRNPRCMCSSAVAMNKTNLCRPPWHIHDRCWLQRGQSRPGHGFESASQSCLTPDNRGSLYAFHKYRQGPGYNRVRVLRDYQVWHSILSFSLTVESPSIRASGSHQTVFSLYLY